MCWHQLREGSLNNPAFYPQKGDKRVPQKWVSERGGGPRGWIFRKKEKIIIISISIKWISQEGGGSINVDKFFFVILKHFLRHFFGFLDIR